MEKRVTFGEYEKTLACVHCGFCLPACPTYRVLGEEADSPRGRIRLIRSYAEGLIPIDDSFKAHIDLCLLCRACETACPSGVQFGTIMEAAREEVSRNHPGKFSERVTSWLTCEVLFPSPRMLRGSFSILRLYQKWGFQSLARRLHILDILPGKPSRFDSMLPRIPGRFFSYPRDGIVKPMGERRYRVGFLTGCVMSTLFSSIDEATVRVLSANGCEVVIPRSQVCCGALNAHSGALKTALEMARRNIDTFSDESLDAIIVNSAGCGAIMKEYGELLRDDPNYAARARNFSSKVKDVSEFLASVELNEGFGEVRAKATFQDPCHLAHGQRVRAQPRILAKKVPGVELVEMKDSDRCCGSAGDYFMKHYDVSMKLLEEKVKNVASTGAEVVLTANPPCLIQLDYGLKRYGLKARVMHVVELLDRSYTLAGAYKRPQS